VKSLLGLVIEFIDIGCSAYVLSQEIQGLDRAGIKKRYRELRKSGQNTHEKGGGIGMYEIAKASDSIDYSFEPINEDKYYFTMRSIVQIKKF